MIRGLLIAAGVAGLLSVYPLSSVVADDSALEENSFACSGFDGSLLPVNFGLTLNRDADQHSIAFHQDQSSGLFGAIENLERISPAAGTETNEYFVVDDGQRLRISLEEESAERLTVLVRGTHPSDDPTFVAIARCQNVSEGIAPTSMIVAKQTGNADKQRGRPIRVSQRIGFVCAFLSSPDHRANLTLLPDTENSFLDKAEYELGDFSQSGSASVMGEALDGVQAFRAIVSLSDATLTFTTNGKTGWVRTIPNDGTDSAPDYGVCLNSDSASGKSAQ